MNGVHHNGSEQIVDNHLGRVTLNNLKKWKDGIHQVEISTDQVDSHDDIRIRTIRVAEALKKRGIGLGDVMVLCGDTHSNICLPAIASFYIGCAFFPFSPTFAIGEMKRLLSLCHPNIIFCDPSVKGLFLRALEELNMSVEIVIFGEVTKSENVTPFSEFLTPTGTEDTFEVTDFDPDTTISNIMCSSGTTGLPKGVCHSHKSNMNPIRNINIFMRLPPDCTEQGFYLTFSNYYWISSVFTLLMTCIVGIPRLVCTLPFSDELLVKAMKKYKPHMVFLSPVNLHIAIKSKLFNEMDFSCVKSFLIGGSVTSGEAIKTIKNKLTNGCVVNGYGSTEVGHLSSWANNGDSSVGKVCPWLKWKIVDVETRKEVKPGEVGEMCVKSDTLFLKYYKDPENTKQAFDDDGYYKTGDLLKYNEEGFLFFVDRLKEVIKFRNFQITPVEVEMEILKVPGVHQVCVVGKKHKEDGEHPIAFVQKVTDSTVTEEDIHNAVNDNLANHKQLRAGIVFIEKLPETSSGKISRSVLKQLAQEI